MSQTIPWYLNFKIQTEAANLPKKIFCVHLVNYFNPQILVLSSKYISGNSP